MTDLSPSFAADLFRGTTYSMLLGLESLWLCLPVAVLFAFALKKENAVSRPVLYVLDVFIALPNQLLLLTIAGLLGGTWWALLISIFVTQTPLLIRHLRVYVRQAYVHEYVAASRALGASRPRIVVFHILPRLFLPLAVSALSLIKRVILSESLLTFLGLGFDPLTPSLGRLLSEGREYLFLAPERFLLPVAVLVGLLYALQGAADRFSTLFTLPEIRYL